MRKNKILLLTAVALFLNGCSCSVTHKSQIVENPIKTTNNTGTNNTGTNNTGTGNTGTTNTNPGGSGSNGGGTGTVVQPKDNTYHKQGDVSIEGRLEFDGIAPEPTISAPYGVQSGTVEYYYTEIENKNVSVDFNNLSGWDYYLPSYYFDIAPGDYALIAFYVNDYNQNCYTNTFDFTVHKGKLDPEYFAISNEGHTHILPYTQSTETLADVEKALAEYSCYCLDEGNYEAESGYEGTVVFEDNTLALELGPQIYTVVFTDNSGYFEPFVCEVGFNVITESISTSDVKLLIKQDSSILVVPYGQGNTEIDYTGKAYSLSLQNTTLSSSYEINFQESTGGAKNIINPGEYTVVVSLKFNSLFFWINDDGTINFDDLKFNVIINKIPPTFELSAYLRGKYEPLTTEHRIIDGDTRTLYVGEYRIFEVCQNVGDESSLKLNYYNCRVDIVSNDGCIEKSAASNYRIDAIKQGKAVVDVIFTGTNYYLETKVARVELNVVDLSQTYTFQNYGYQTGETGLTGRWNEGSGFDEDLGVITYGGDISGFLFTPKGAFSMSFVYSFSNITPPENGEFCNIAIKSLETSRSIIELYFTGTVQNVTNEKFKFSIDEEYRNSTLIFIVSNTCSSSDSAIYMKSITFNYKQ